MSPLARRTSPRRPALGLALGVAAATVAILGLALTVHGGPQDEVTRRDYGIGGFKPPPRWELLPRDRPSYPQLLAWASRGQGNERAVITLVAKRLLPGTPLQVFAQEANGLRSRARTQGLRVQVQSQLGWFSGQRVQVDAQLAAEGSERQQSLRQIFFINPPFGYVLTLVAPVEQAAARYRDLDDTAANLVPIALPSVSQLPSIAPPGAAPPDAGIPADLTPPAPNTPL